MDARLIKKDLILIKNYIFPILIFGLLLFIGLSYSFPTGLMSGMGMIAGCLFVEYFFINALFSMEHKYQGAALILASPYTRSMVIKGRYLTLVLALMVNVFLYSLLAVVMTDLFTGEFAPLSFHHVLTAFGEAALFIAVTVPVYFKFDYLKARPISMILLFLMGYGTGFIKYLGDEYSLSFLEKQAAVDLFSLVLGGGILLASLFLTFRIHEKKEF